MNILLITPPFTQLNTPYPATAYIKGYLKTINIESQQLDLGLETILRIFSKEGLQNLFSAVASDQELDNNCQRILALKDKYINSVDAVIDFLQDKDPTLAHAICERNFLPEANKFSELDELGWAFGTMGIRDQARHLATLFLEDLGDFISDVVDPQFGFSRYAERISLSAKSFDDLYKAVNTEHSYVMEQMLVLLQEKCKIEKPDLVCLSVPFPGNLFAALKIGQLFKINHPNTKVALGGGYANTELRSLKDSRIFEFLDYITLDDGETPLTNLIEHLNGKREAFMLKRTFALENGKVIYHDGSLNKDVAQRDVGTPDYDGLPLRKYLSVIQLTNPMHRMWSDGRWNKLTMAHGCYWGKCTFCDVSLDYIKNYEASSAALIVDRMEQLVRETGERGFHFVDEAAPPALMKGVALEILRRNLIVTWWTNIRFEKSFHFDLCRLLAESGCVAVSGGLEVASDRLLKLIDKGVTLEQVTQVTDNFTRSGIMVHAYLMYGFPTQTDQETIDSLEVVRQLFEADVLQSGFWHRFAMTAHSPVGLAPEKFKVSISDPEEGSFGNNDLQHEDPTGGDHDKFSNGLKKSLYNYMHGVGLDFELQEWFDDEVPETEMPAEMIEGFLNGPRGREIKGSNQIYWLGGPVEHELFDQERLLFRIYGQRESREIKMSRNKGEWLSDKLVKLTDYGNLTTYRELQKDFEEAGLGDFTLFWFGKEMEKMKEWGLLVL